MKYQDSIDCIPNASEMEPEIHFLLFGLLDVLDGNSDLVVFVDGCSAMLGPQERNREHAKRSRIRKKFMLECLQEQLLAMRKQNMALRQVRRAREGVRID